MHKEHCSLNTRESSPLQYMHLDRELAWLRSGQGPSRVLHGLQQAKSPKMFSPVGYKLGMQTGRGRMACPRHVVGSNISKAGKMGWLHARLGLHVCMAFE